METFPVAQFFVENIFLKTLEERFSFHILATTTKCRTIENSFLDCLQKDSQLKEKMRGNSKDSYFW